MENARLLIFETYCRIHQCIDLGMLADKLNMEKSAAETWVVNLIRNARLNAKIDSQVPLPRLVAATWPRPPPGAQRCTLLPALSAVMVLAARFSTSLSASDAVRGRPSGRLRALLMWPPVPAGGDGGDGHQLPHALRGGGRQDPGPQPAVRSACAAVAVADEAPAVVLGGRGCVAGYWTASSCPCVVKAMHHRTGASRTTLSRVLPVILHPLMRHT